MVALLLAMVGVPAYQQFTPGRIDHHNVQIALTLLAVAATVWSDRKRWARLRRRRVERRRAGDRFREPAVSRGLRRGVRAALRGRSRRRRGAARLWTRARAVARRWRSRVSVGPAHWTRSLCDAIAINNAAAAICAGLVLALAGWLRHRASRDADRRGARRRRRGRRRFCCCSSRAASRGPLAMVDPAIWPIWLGEVREMQPLLSVWRKQSADRRGHRRVSRRWRCSPPWCCCASGSCAAILGFSRAVAGVPRRGGHHGRRRSAPIPMRCGSACRWSRCWRCGCSRRCGSRRVACRAWLPAWR